MNQFTYVCPTAEDTQSVAAVLGACLKGGEVLAFHSDLGGGKTTFVKGLAKGMGVVEVVQSPTFTISQLHKAAHDLELHHYDFYRLDEPGIMRAELAESLTQPNAVVAIEWGDSVHDILPANQLSIRLASAPHGEARTVIIEYPPSLPYITDALNIYKNQKGLA